MDAKTVLLREDRVLWHQFKGYLDMAQVGAYLRQAHLDYVVNATKRIHAIMDLSETTGLSANAVSQGLRLGAERARSPMAGITVFVVHTTYFKSLVEVMSKLSQKMEYHVVQTVDEALAIIDQALESEKVNDNPPANE